MPLARDVTGMDTVATSLPFPVTKDRYGRVNLRGTRLSLSRLMAEVIWAFEREQKAHPGTPYNLDCVIQFAIRNYAENYPQVSFQTAEQAIGLAVLRLFELSLRRQATVLEAAFPTEENAIDAEAGSYKDARGAAPPPPGAELPETIIRRLRGG